MANSGADSTRVLFLITGLGNGGAERVSLDLFQMLDKEDSVEVELASLSNDVSGLDVFDHRDTRVNVFGLELRTAFHSLIRLLYFSIQFRPNVIHAHMFHALFVALLLKVFFLPHTKICFTSHTSMRGISKFRRLFFILTKFLRSADIVFSQKQHPAIDIKNTLVIGNGVKFDDLASIDIDGSVDDKFVVLCVGRLHPIKRPTELIDQFYRFGEPNSELHFCGDGPLMAECVALVSSLGLSGKVFFHGVVSDVRLRMRSASLLVLSSEHEGMPMVVLEAGAEKLPVLATPVGNLPELLSDGRGYICDLSSFASKMRSISAGRREAIDCSNKLYDFVKYHYSLETVAAKHLDLYVKLLS